MTLEDAVRLLRKQYTFVDLSDSTPKVIVIDGAVRLTLEEAIRVIETQCTLPEVIADRARSLRARLRNTAEKSDN